MRFLLVLPLLIFTSLAQEPPATVEPAPQEENPFAGLEFQTGTVQLPKKLARLELPEGYSYVKPSAARKLLELLPHAPPPGIRGIQGMVVPPDAGPGQGWIALLVYVEEGHVADGEIQRLDGASYLAHLKTQNAEENKKLKAEGQPAYELKDWEGAALWQTRGITDPLCYNSNTKILAMVKRYWNERAPDGERNRFEHEHWVLGRSGVLIVRAFSLLKIPTASMNGESSKLAQWIQFAPGSRHQDFNPKTDKLAEIMPLTTPPVDLVALGKETKEGISRAFMRKLPLLLIVGLAVLIKRWMTKMEEA